MDTDTALTDLYRTTVRVNTTAYAFPPITETSAQRISNPNSDRLCHFGKSREIINARNAIKSYRYGCLLNGAKEPFDLAALRGVGGQAREEIARGGRGFSSTPGLRIGQCEVEPSLEQ